MNPYYNHAYQKQTSEAVDTCWSPFRDSLYLEMTGVAPVYSIETTMCIYFESTLTTYLDKQTRIKEGYF